MEKLEKQIAENISVCETLETQYQYKLSREISDARWRMFGAPGDVGRAVADVEEKLKAQRNDFLDANEREMVEYDQLFVQLQKQVSDFTTYNDLGKVEFVANQVRNVNKSLAKCQENTKRFNLRTSGFGTKSSTNGLYSSKIRGKRCGGGVGGGCGKGGGQRLLGLVGCAGGGA